MEQKSPWQKSAEDLAQQLALEKAYRYYKEEEYKELETRMKSVTDELIAVKLELELLQQQTEVA